MPFVPFQSSIYAGRNKLSGAVRFARVGAHRGRSGRLTIATDLFARMGEPARIAFMVGTGPDAGRVMLLPSDDGYVVIRRASTATSRAVTLPAGIGARAPARSVNVPHELRPDGLVVDLSRFMQPEAPAAIVRLHVA